MTWLKELFFIITHPKYWIMNYDYSPLWDEELDNLMETETFKLVSECRATLGGFHIWIGNHPYASFTPLNAGPTVRPSRITIHEAKKKLERDVLRSNKGLK